MATDQKDGAEVDEYDGPWIERRIEWKCPDRKQHDVVLFGSWNRFRGGDELEYQGKQIYAVTAKLPLGNYVYRFMIDGEEWETNNATAKTVKDGIEYNTISVKQGGDSDDEDDEDEDEDNEADAGAKDDKSENAALIFDAKKQKFVVGNKRKGKRRGRPSMELDLGQNFDGEDADDEETTDGKTSDNASTTTDGAGGAADDGGKKKGKKRKKKTKKYTNKQNVDMAQEKEWARYVFVQQLRQQQQHNDEINRVKTLWKQERQVRVEMHKKVVKEKKKLQKDLAQLKADKERLEKLNQISTDADTKLVVSLENDKKRLEGEVESMRDQLKQAREEISDIRKQKNESEKSTRDNQSDWETKRKKLEGEIEEWKKEVANLQASKNSVQESLNALQTGNKKTMSIQSEQVADLQKRWEDSRKDNDKLQADFKKSRKDWEEKEAKYKKDLEKVSEELSQSQKEVKHEKANCSKLEEKNNKLKSENGKLKNSKEAEEKIKVEVERVTKEAGEEKAQLSDKIKSLNDKIEQLKADHAKEIDGVKQQSQAEIDALAAKSDSEMSSHLDKLKQEIETRDTQIKTQKDTIDKLEGQLSEQKTNCDNSDKKLASLSESHNALTKDKEACDKENATMREEIEKLQKDLKTATDDASAQNDASTSKIENLEKEITASKDRFSAEAKELEEQNTKLNEKIAQLAEDLTKKAGETTEISAKMTEIEQELASYKSKDDANKVKIDGLEKSLADEKAEASNKAGEYQKQIDDVSAQMESLRSEKDGKITELEDTLAKVQHEMSDKLKEFHNAETKIKEMESQVEAQQKQFKLQKDDYEKQLEGAREKDGRIHESCKKLNAQCEGLRGELKAIKDLKISQLEEMVNAFKEFSPVLDKVFAFNQNMVDDLMQKYKRELTLRRKYFNIVQDLRGNIRVFCRVRPILPFEIKKGDTSCLKFPEPGKIQVTDDKSQVHPFEFDQVYAPGTSQEAVSEDTTEYIQSVMDGYNVSIFAYGQTGSGKTYTMDGSAEEPGVNLRALKHLFKMAEERAPQFEYKIKVSILEIYNEKIRDLIPKKKKSKKADKKKAGGDFKILHLPDGSVEVQGLNWVSVKSDNDVIGLSELAKSQRTAGVTDMNAHSSRSHMLLIVDVHGFNLPANIEYLGKLYLVDLAGSERVKKSGATGQALKEAQNINKSLAALGDVMQSLQKKDKFIPYRNSTLTDLMTNSLGGNAKTVMFINCCPTARHAFETVSSLKFAQRVGKVELGQAKAKSKKKKSGK